MSALEQNVEASEQPANNEANDEQTELEQQEELGVGVVVVTVVTPTNAVIVLPPLGSAEALPFNVKQLLNGYRESCVYSAYLLEYRSAEGDGILLNDFVEIIAAVPEIAETGVLELHMVLQDYTLHDIKLHMKHTYDVIQHPRSLKGSTSPVTEEPPSVDAVSTKKSKQKVATKEVNDVLFNASSEVSLKDFYREAMYVFTSAGASGGKKSGAAPLKSGIRSIAYSGWNPPPPSRKLQGDICYIDIDTTNGLFSLTAIASGFFLNRSVHKTSFDPRPANGNCYFSHELINVILALSPSTTAFMESPPRSAVIASEWTMDSIANQMSAGRGSDVFVNRSVCWVSPIADNTSPHEKITHEYNISRAMEAYSNVVDLDVISPITSPAKEWNQELQAVRATIPPESSDAMVNAKNFQALHRLYQDFKDTASAVAVAVLDGHITAINPGEPREQQIFIYNNIFFSYAADTVGSFKLCYGDEACRKMYAQDMQNQRLIQTANITGLNTVLTCLVDYKGFRIVAQSMIPGVLQMGENAARLMYGSIEQGARLKCKTKARELMTCLAESMHLAERDVIAMPRSVTSVTIQEAPAAVIPENEQNIRLDDIDEVFPTDVETIKHIGPIECKMLQGADNKHYLLEVARLTPLDANYVKKANGGTGNIADEVLDTFDQTMFVTYTLRQELLNLYRIYCTRSIILNSLSESAAKGTDEKDVLETAATSDVIAAPTLNAEGDEPVAASTAPGLPPVSLASELKKAPDVSGVEKSALSAIKSTLVNPNVFVELGVSLSGEKSEDLLADEETARMMGDFLWNTVIPKVTEDIRMMNQVIIDGEALTKFMHEYGINLRYLGRIAEVALSEESKDEELHKEGKIRINPMPKYWLEMLEMEMIARAMKHIVTKIIRENPNSYLSSTAGLITDLLCFLFGSSSPSDPALVISDLDNKKSSNKKKKSKKNTQETSSGDNNESFISSTKTAATIPDTTSKVPFGREKFWQALSERVKTYFGGKITLLTTDTVLDEQQTSLSTRIPRIPLLRRVCQQLGISVAAADYNFNTLRPFAPADIQAVFPKAKMPAVDTLPYVDDLRQKAQLYASKGHIENSNAIFQQAGMCLEQINGMHCREMCVLNEDFAKVLLQFNQLESALSVMERNLITSIRVSGLDSPMTLHQHLTLGTIYMDLQLIEEASKHFNSAAYLVSIVAGKAHPEASGIIMNLADIATRVGDYAGGLVYLNELKERFERGGDVIKIAYINQNMAALYEALKALPEAKVHQNSAYQLFRQMFGESDPRTIDAKEKYAHLLRSDHSQQMSLLEQRQNDEAAKKERERLRWLEDEDGTTAKAALKKKKSNKKSKK